MIVRLLEHTPNPEKLIAMAAKLCYSPVGIDEISKNLDFNDITPGFIKMLMELGHESPLEHCYFTFGVEGCSRITEQQLTRHRIASYSIQSGRYVLRNNAKFVIPPNIERNKVAKKIYLDQVESCRKAYWDIVVELIDYNIDQIVVKDPKYLFIMDDLMKDPELINIRYSHLLKERSPILYEKIKTEVIKEAIEDARYVLPQSLETKIMFTMNLRSLMNFVSHRKCNRAQWEIRELTRQMLDEVKNILPTAINYIGAPCEFGKCPEGKKSCGKPYRKKVA